MSPTWGWFVRGCVILCAVLISALVVRELASRTKLRRGKKLHGGGHLIGEKELVVEAAEEKIRFSGKSSEEPPPKFLLHPDEKFTPSQTPRQRPKRRGICLVPRRDESFLRAFSLERLERRSDERSGIPSEDKFPPNYSSGCLFCRRARAGRAEEGLLLGDRGKLYRGEKWTEEIHVFSNGKIIRDRADEFVKKGHFLVIPTSHIGDDYRSEDLTEDLLSSMCQAVCDLFHPITGKFRREVEAENDVRKRLILGFHRKVSEYHLHLHVGFPAATGFPDPQGKWRRYGSGAGLMVSLDAAFSYRARKWAKPSCMSDFVTAYHPGQ